MPELLKCQVCRATTERDRVFGACGICEKQVCAQCQRVCDNCLQIFCMFHVHAKDVWTQGVMRRMKLCHRCEPWV